eukprot:COSAG01_NODE_11942_length_1829_cov_168.017341_4_plen_70_part_00
MLLRCAAEEKGSFGQASDARSSLNAIPSVLGRHSHAARAAAPSRPTAAIAGTTAPPTPAGEGFIARAAW